MLTKKEHCEPFSYLVTFLSSGCCDRADDSIMNVKKGYEEHLKRDPRPYAGEREMRQVLINKRMWAVWLCIHFSLHDKYFIVVCVQARS